MTDIVLQVVLLLAGLAILMKASDWTIRGALRIAHIARISEAVVGFLFVAVATSFPEMSIAVTGVLTGEIGISIGNLLGANIADIALIIGIGAIAVPITVRKGVLQEMSLVLLLSSLVPIMLLGLAQASNVIGLLLLGIFGAFLFYTIKRNISLDKPHPTEHANHLGKALLLFGVGIAGVIISARLVVGSAVELAGFLGVAESAIAASIISMGTTLPELSVTLAALRHGHVAMGLGNAIGSTLINITLILGLVLATSAFAINLATFETILLFALLVNILVLVFMVRGRLDRNEGLILLGTYLLFLMILFGVQLVVF
jgi:cation:H+ antiporter